MFSLKQFVWTCCRSNYQYQINADPRFANIFCRLQTFLWSIIYLVALQEIVSNYRQQLWYSSKYSSQIPNSVTALGSKMTGDLKIKMKIDSNFILKSFCNHHHHKRSTYKWPLCSIWMLWSSQSSRAHLLPVVFSYQHITVPHSQLQCCDIVFSHEICFRFRPHPALVADRRENICNKRENIWCMQRRAVVVVYRGGLM